MRIILTADVHGNLPALEAVLDHGRIQGGEEHWDLGDQVGYGPFPDEVVSLLAEEAHRAVIGNYDRKVLDVKKKDQKWRKKKNPLKLLAFEWALDKLSRKNRRWLEHLPEKLKFECMGFRIRLSHKGPNGEKNPLKPGVEHGEFTRVADQDKLDVRIFGHTHVPFVCKVKDTWFINPGSVGRPDDGDPRASYALLILEEGTVQVQHFRIPYDVERAVERAHKCGLPEEFGRMLREGHSLDDLDSG